jgi:hypothetical protein
MATLSDNDDVSIRMVLETFKHFESRPGRVLRHNNLLAVMAENCWRAEDMNAGMKLCAELGYIEIKSRTSYALTDAGFAAM